MQAEVVFSDFYGTFSDHPELKGEVQAIVTGRSWQEAQDLYDEVGDLDIPVFFNPVTTKENNANKIILHKAEVLNRCKVTKYYEDVREEAAQLKILVPSSRM